MFEYQKHQKYFAQVSDKTEALCEQELRDLGARKTHAVYRGVWFVADTAALYKINYMSRLVTRVLAPLLTFSCHSTKYLTKTAHNIAWEKFLSPDKTFAINASVSSSAITHSYYAALCLKDGIADYFREKFGKRPDVDTDNPDVRINVHIEHNKAIVSLDTSGESLHKRGYRQSGVAAPMQETLAAACVALSAWDEKRPFWDCMCGSGTIVCEALMRYSRIPAQYLRKKFGFSNLPDFSPEIWETVKKQCLDSMRPLPRGLICGSDISPKAISVARQNIQKLPYADSVAWRVSAFDKMPAFENGVIVCNPPYGVRLETKENVAALYKDLGNFIKKNCNGTTAHILVGDLSLRKFIGLKPSARHPMTNGKIDCELVRIDSYRVRFRKDAGGDDDATAVQETKADPHSCAKDS